MHIKMAEFRLHKKCYSFWIIEEIYMKFWYNNSKASSYAMQKFHVRIFWHIWEVSRQRAPLPARVGPVHHGYRLYIEK